ncbi:MAG: hypothetical protein L3K18_07690 [Thermoplasmata archaeon]|nr:hypothetical protein [Thermoplasmata archaeon]
MFSQKAPFSNVTTQWGSGVYWGTNPQTYPPGCAPTFRQPHRGAFNASTGAVQLELKASVTSCGSPGFYGMLHTRFTIGNFTYTVPANASPNLTYTLWYHWNGTGVLRYNISNVSPPNGIIAIVAGVDAGICGPSRTGPIACEWSATVGALANGTRSGLVQFNFTRPGQFNGISSTHGWHFAPGQVVTLQTVLASWIYIDAGSSVPVGARASGTLDLYSGSLGFTLISVKITEK